MNKQIIGKYNIQQTPIHKLDPRLKFLALIMFTVSIFLTYGSWTLMFVLAGINAVVILAIMIIARVRFVDILIQLRTLWVMVIFLLAINIFVPPNGSVHIIAYTNNFALYAESLLQSARILIRLLEMFGIAMVLTSTTSPQQITQGISFFFKPLKKIKFPSEEIAMTISIALRFIPTLLEETQTIYKAQASRGIDFKKGSLSAKFKGVTALIIPLFVMCFSMSDDLAFALEARGYDPRASRTQYRQLHWQWIDSVCLILVILYMIAFIVLTVMKIDFIKDAFPFVW